MTLVSWIIKLSLGFSSHASTVSIPVPAPQQKPTLQKPASDLVQNGRTLEVGEATALAAGGSDLSDLNPLENKIWQNQAYATTDAEKQNYPLGEIGVQFVSFEAQDFGTSLVRVESKATPGAYFRLGISRFSQSVMMRAALLRKLGFYIPSPRYYKKLKVVFGSEAEKDLFLEEVQKDVGDFESRKWMLENNKKEHFIVLSSGTLEVMTSESFDIQWGYAPNPDEASQKPLVDQLSKNRAYRALLLPYTLVDVPESVNRYAAQMVLVQAGYATLTQTSAKSFQSCTYEDMRWILKRLQKLTLQDYQEIVREGSYPAELEELVLAKLVSRAEQILRVFALNPTVAKLPLQVSNATGSVKSGKLLKEFIEGYPQRFSHGERTSPFSEGDLGRYLGVDLKSSVLATVLSRLNEKIQLQTVGDLARKYQERALQDFRNKLLTNPSKAFEREVVGWGGPVAGFNADASRHIATGTYNGSTAAVQLVDHISIGASVGYFRGYDGVPKVIPSISGNLQVVRDYIHVRPILSIQEGSKVSWKDLSVPSHMKKIVDILATDEIEQKNPSAENATAKQKSLDVFLSSLRTGEVFTISDSVVLGLNLQVQSRLDILLQLTPLNFINSVALGADASRVVLRQTSFLKTDRGVQIFVRDLRNKGAGVEFNMNYYLQLLRMRTQMSTTDLNTDAFVIDYDAALAAESDPDSEMGAKWGKTRNRLRSALYSLFKHNELELLYGNFANQKFVLQHELKTKETKLDFLAAKTSQFEEEHLLRLQYPRNEDFPELDPKDEEVTLYSHKKGKLEGLDVLGLFFNILESWLSNNNKNITISKALSDNPANVPYGKAKWVIVKTEADLTVNGKKYPSVAQIQHVWGGWSMKKDKFMSLLTDIEKQFTDPNVIRYPLFNRDNLMNMKSLDFFRVTANLSVLESGVQKLKALFRQSHLDGKPVPKAEFLARLFQKLSEKQGPPRAGDKGLFESVMKILGNGNQKTGEALYMNECKNPKQHGDSAGPAPSTWLYGTVYECLDDWMTRMIKLGREIPADRKAETRWTTEALRLLDEHVPMPQLLQYLGSENYLFFVRVSGFRPGDEDGDLEFYSNTMGDPQKNYDEAGGLFQLYAKKTRIVPLEVDRTQGGYE